MGKLIYSAIGSLDGYVADREGKFEWTAPGEDVHGSLSSACATTMEAMSPRMPLFCSLDLAARIERAEARFMEDGVGVVRARVAALAIPIAGGVASWAGEGSPLNKVAGLGFGGLPGEDALAAVERAFDERRSPVQVELCNLAEDGIGALLTRRGYRLTGFENVLGLRLPLGAGGRGVAPDVDVRESDDADLEAWLDAIVEGFARPDTPNVHAAEVYSRSVLEPLVRDLSRVNGLIRYTARHAGVIAGGASLRLGGGVAHLVGAATHPDHRRQGVQTSLLAVRLARAAHAGCEVAVVTTQPGSKSQRNVQRQGFDLLYTRAVLVREPA
jgi:ribosomal protein S18 acetylase RimI-like enzyme